MPGAYQLAFFGSNNCEAVKTLRDCRFVTECGELTQSAPEMLECAGQLAPTARDFSQAFENEGVVVVVSRRLEPRERALKTVLCPLEISVEQEDVAQRSQRARIPAERQALFDVRTSLVEILFADGHVSQVGEHMSRYRSAVRQSGASAGAPIYFKTLVLELLRTSSVAGKAEELARSGQQMDKSVRIKPLTTGERCLRPMQALLKG